MTLGTRAGSRQDGLLSFNQRWTPINPLTEARDRRRLGDTNINYDSHRIQPMVSPIVRSISPDIVQPLIQPMGATTIEHRRNIGSRSLWANTPVAGMPTIVGDADIDITDIITGWDRVGWRWDRRSNKLCAYLTSGHKTYTVKIGLKKLLRIFNRHYQANGGEKEYFRERTLDGFFKKLSRKLKKATKSVAKGTKRMVTSPVRFIKNPKKFIRETSKELKSFVKGAGKAVLKVASSPVFAGVMTAIAAVPPIGTAIGGAGLAAYAAANAIKPAFNLAEKAIDTVDSAKAKGVVASFKNAVPQLPSGAKSLMTAALQSTDSLPVKPSERRKRKSRGAFRFFPKSSSLRRLS